MRRATVKDDEELAEVVKAQQVPREQFFGTLRLFGDAILAYQGQHERSGPYRFYPAILVSAWASFEAYVRIYSELFVRTAKNLPATISDALLEIDSFLDAQGRIQKRAKFQPLLGRYWWLLKFGYSCDFDRGSRIWQLGEAALRARSELVHYEIQGMPSLKTIELWALSKRYSSSSLDLRLKLAEASYQISMSCMVFYVNYGRSWRNTKRDRISSIPV